MRTFRWALLRTNGTRRPVSLCLIRAHRAAQYSKSSYYLNGSAFKDNTAYASEVYAVSPVIDLAGVEAPVCSFEHAAKFQTTLRTLCGMVVREEGTTAWTALTIPTWPEAGAWTWAESGNIDLAAYAGKKIQVGFKYGSSAAGADTWEIRNLKFDITNGVADVEAEAAEAVYYNLQGVQMQGELTPGLYIRRQGNTASAHPVGCSKQPRQLQLQRRLHHW